MKNVLNTWSRSERLTLYALLVAIVTAIAALLVVPEIRRLVGLDFSHKTFDTGPSPTPNVPSSHSSTPALNGDSTAAFNVNKPEKKSEDRSAETSINPIEPPNQIPFQISSINSQWPMGIMLKGGYRIYPDFIKIDVANVLVQLRRFNWMNYNGPRRLVSINIVLVRTPADKPSNWGGWDEIGFGEGFKANCEMNPGDQCTLSDLHFSIPKDTSIDLSKHWLVVRLEDQLLNAENTLGYEYAHGDRRIFAQR